MGALSGIKLSRPTYDDVVPSSGKKVKLTPFRVGDEKTLLIAAQSSSMKDMNNALKSVVKNCVQGIEIEELEQYDLEYLFLKLRAKSVGEHSEIAIRCESCGAMNQLSVDLEAVVVEKSTEHKNIVKIEEALAFKMKFPDPELISDLDATNPNDMIKIVVMSVETVYSGEEAIEINESDRDELKELIESMTKEQFEKMEEFFETLPRLKKDVQFICGECSHDNNQTLEGLASFF